MRKDNSHEERQAVQCQERRGEEKKVSVCMKSEAGRERSGLSRRDMQSRKWRGEREVRASYTDLLISDSELFA